MTEESRTTRAFVLESRGYDGLVLRTREVPAPGAGKVLVRMKAASLNFRDLKILRGEYAPNPDLPVVLLCDGAGEVVDVGPGVSRYQAGDRVLCTFWEGWHTGSMAERPPTSRRKGGDVDGTALEYAVYDEAELLPVPPSLSYEQAACLPCAGVTAWHSLVYEGHIKAGDTVLILGSGGVSLFGLQIAKMSGARVIATSSDDAKLRRLINLGAWEGVNYRKVPDWGRAVRALTGGRGVDIALEVGGSGNLGQTLRATRDGGLIQCVGNLSGGFVRSADTSRGIRTKMIAVGSREMTEDLIRAVDLHHAMPVIDSQFPFTRLKEALVHLESGQHFGKVVITF
jgi:NADPH:quinone reductase-like Zn-dependent oxidoreductase